MVMRAVRPVLLASLVACAHEPVAPTVVQHTPADILPVAVEAAPPPQYVVADATGKDVISLGKDGMGVIVDGLRVVVASGQMRVGKDLADPPLVGGQKLPAWMGTGFLFHSTTSLYVAETFDGPLKPVVSFPTEIDDVRFGPKYALVHASSGQRWPIDLKTGARVAASPVGVADIAAGADGRAVALAEFGGVLVTGDGGAKWLDVSSQLQGPVDELRTTDDGEVWVVAQTGPSARLEAGGRIALIDKAPDVKPPTLRQKDPRWKSSDSPIRRALSSGIADGDRIAIVVVDGSVARVDVGTGQVISFSQGRLPPDANCEAVRTTDDVVFACSRRNGSSFVASHVLADKAPVIEQSFSVPATFFAGDDGGLAYGASCSGKASNSTVCVRAPGGVWQEYDVDPSADGGASAGSVEIARWIPRADGGIWGLVTGSSPGLWDVRAGSFHPLAGDALTSPSTRHYYKRGYYSGSRDGRAVDRVWTATGAGTLRGWSDNGLTSFEVRLDGTVTASPFTFEQAQTSGAFAFARAQGRAWQSTDRGVTWAEVEAPPLGLKAEMDIRSCSMLGCDLGKWYRIGWSAAPPTPRPDPVIARGPSRVLTATLPLLSCKSVGTPTTGTVTRSNSSPEDLGLGAQKLAVSSDNGETTYVRTMFQRGAVNPAHGEEGSVDREDAAVRMVMHGFQTDSGSGGHFTVMGPTKDPLALRRSVSFVAPFDPTGAVRRTSFGIVDLVAAARTVGMTSSDVLNEDPSIANTSTTVLATDPTAAGDILWSSELGMVGATRGIGRTKVTMRPQLQDTAWPASAAWMGTDDLVLLELDATGLSHVSRWTGNAIMSLFDVPAPPRPELYPANPDAVAIGPKGEVALLRTPSGEEPATDSSPALLYLHGQPPTPLAAWSTLTLADDPACKSDPGFRAIVHTVKPWVRLPPELTQADARMVARVKWSATRVCLEAVEVRTPDVKVTAMQRGDDPNEKTYSTPVTVETWAVARFAGGASAVRVGVVPGVEWRQGMSCTLTP
jgi:hypothetical protein